MSRISRLVFFSLSVVVLGLTGCPSSCTGPSTTTGQTGGQPSLIATYCFSNTIGTEPFTLRVTFTGTTSATGTGQASFTQTEAQQFRPSSPRECIATRIRNLRSGTWTVTAKPDAVAAPHICPAITVPGTVTLDVSGPQPSCSN
jgi:hypothetical protein